MPDDIESNWLNSLLAAIHIDDGQYQLLHGTQKAVDEAIIKVCKMRSHRNAPAIPQEVEGWYGTPQAHHNLEVLRGTRAPQLAALLVETWQTLCEDVHDHALELQEQLQRLGILVMRTDDELRQCWATGDCTCAELFDTVEEMVSRRHCYRINPLIELPTR